MSIEWWCEGKLSWEHTSWQRNNRKVGSDKRWKCGSKITFFHGKLVNLPQQNRSTVQKNVFLKHWVEKFSIRRIWCSYYGTRKENWNEKFQMSYKLGLIGLGTRKLYTRPTQKCVNGTVWLGMDRQYKIMQIQIRAVKQNNSVWIISTWHTLLKIKINKMFNSKFKQKNQWLVLIWNS